jgi:hypothetical protein
VNGSVASRSLTDTLTLEEVDVSAPARSEAMIYRIGGASGLSISADGNQIVSERRNGDCPLLRFRVIEITTRAAKFLS